MLDFAVAKNFAPLPTEVSGVLSERQQRQWTRAESGRLPRGRTLPQLVSEFASIGECTGALPVQSKTFRVLRSFYRKNGDSGAPQDHTSKVHIIGTWREPSVFVKEALERPHPIDAWSTVPDVTKRAAFEILTQGPVDISRARVHCLMELKRVKASLADRERQLQDRVPSCNKAIMSVKHLALFEHLIIETGFGDVDLVEDMIRGFDVVGVAPRSHELHPRLVPATSTPKEIQMRSKWSKRITLAKCKSSGDESLDSEVFRQTMEQRDMKWLRGPFKESELDSLFPQGWVPICRFGLKQTDKTRVIDECRGPAINFALTTTEKLGLMDVDDLSAVL